MQYYIQKYRFISETAKWNKKITALKCEKKTFKLIISFSEIPKFFTCARVRQLTFLSEDWENLFVWSSVLLQIVD